MLTACEVSEHLIDASLRQGDPLSHSKLQCLLYYAQSWHLALFDRRLFPDQIEAWESGPVVPLVLENFDRLSLNVDDDFALLDEMQQGYLECILEKYDSVSGQELQEQVQSEAPWLAARATTPAADTFAIEMRDMKLFYRYPASDIFIRVVRGVLVLLVRLRIYKTATTASAWAAKAWEAWKILCSYFGMIP